MERNVSLGAQSVQGPASGLLAQASVQVCGALLMVAVFVACFLRQGGCRAREITICLSEEQHPIRQCCFKHTKAGARWHDPVSAARRLPWWAHVHLLKPLHGCGAARHPMLGQNFFLSNLVTTMMLSHVTLWDCRRLAVPELTLCHATVRDCQRLVLTEISTWCLAA